jgi:hypothetical protein
MSKIKTGDVVKIKDRPDWPSPPGYRLANAEGAVTAVQPDEGFVTIRLLKSNTDLPKDTVMTFRLENVKKV